VREALRVALNGFARDMPEAALQRAERAVEDALSAGAFGLSMGLMYAPENSYGASALIRLVRAMGGRGVLAVHLRGEGRNLVASVREALRVAREGGAPLVVSHFKAAGCPANGPAYVQAKALIEDARAAGQDVCVDVYPYTAGSTAITTLLPPSWLAGGLDALCARLAAARGDLREILEHPSDEYDNLLCDIGFEAIRVASAKRAENRPLIGRDIAAIAKERGVHGADVIADLILSERGETTIVNFIVAEENLRDALALPYATYISDALFGADMPHPRVYGAFPRALRMAPSLPEGVRRATSAPAERYGVEGRGRLLPGYYADIVAFDAENLRDNATYEDPKRSPDGISHVWVGGQIALKDGRLTGARGGRALTRKS
jgi:N-acyl-D-aspartate/D-glutamate deacylase